MARQRGIGRLLIVIGLLTGPACAVASDIDMPSRPPAQQVPSDLHKGQTHSGISQDEHVKVTAAPERIAAASEAQPGVAALLPEQRAGSPNDQELITHILTMAGEDGRPTAGARVHLVRRSVPGSV
ncbi:hypothetical protein FHY16_004031 [Xanthomonas campestris]|uniref:hypothetical protein n=1 Tax=Xanthomonas euroxanthea TaxID=2259622 RepID=UPI00179457DD|nr:hypothetical protein [Xanthomonas euroxanthea]MBB3781223.1 hypothetical protein [Xanthomonas euroxanthea]